MDRGLCPLADAVAEDVMAELEAAVRGMARAEEPLEADVERTARGERSEPRPGGRSALRPGDRSALRPGERSALRPGDRPLMRPGERGERGEAGGGALERGEAGGGAPDDDGDKGEELRLRPRSRHLPPRLPPSSALRAPRRLQRYCSFSRSALPCASWSRSRVRNLSWSVSAETCTLL